MAKALGIIGNIKGKVGNVVGYNLTDSNNKQTQGLRVYQPNVKNPKTAAQAEQRAKLAPINATYRALKMIIDRGNEGLPYGNKSRLAWLKMAFNAEHMPWFTKGSTVDWPLGCQLTKGSLPGITYQVMDDDLIVECQGVTSQSTIATVGALSTALLAAWTDLKAGDQITFVRVGSMNGALTSQIDSVVIDTTSSEAIDFILPRDNKISLKSSITVYAGTVIISREGNDGEHLRSTSMLKVDDNLAGSMPYDSDSKSAAIESYMASGSANTDWAEESIQ